MRTWVRRCIVIALAYLATAELARSLDYEGAASIIWPPTGIALAAILLCGRSVWPGIAIGTFVTVILHVESVAVAAWITAVNVAEALLGYWLLRRLLDIHTTLDRIRDAVAFIVVSLAISLISAGLSVCGLVLLERLPVHVFNRLFSSWWWGHLSGDLVVAPLIMTWGSRSLLPQEPMRPRLFEVVLLAVVVVTLDVLLFGEWFPDWLPGEGTPYYLLPLLLWAGLRFGPRGAATASFAVSFMLIGSMAFRGRPFEQLSDLQGFVSITSMTTLVLSAMALERLRALQRKAAIQRAALDSIITVDAGGRLVELNPAAEKLFGYRAADVLGRDAGELLLPVNQRAAYRAALHAYLVRGAPSLEGGRYHATALRADGSEVAVEIAAAHVTFGGETTITGFIRDLTDEHQAAQERRQARELLEAKVRERTAELTRINRDLERSEELLRQAESLAQLGSFELNVETGEVEWSDELYRIFGQDRETFTPSFDALFAAIVETDRERVRSAVRASIDHGDAFDLVQHIRRPDGSIRVLQSRGSVFRNGGEKALRVTGCFQDITEQRAAEEARYRLVDIAASSEDAILGLTVNGTIETWNAAATKIFGYSPAEVIGRSCAMLAHPDLHPELYRRVSLAAAGAHLAHYEMLHVRKDGTVFDASVTISAIRDQEGDVIGLSKVLRDISEQKSFENQLKQSLHEKEVLLREIHHRVKNNLQVISSLLNLQVSTETSERARKGLVESQSRIHSMALVHQQLYQSRDLAHIEFTRYLRELVERLLRTYNVGPERIELAVEGVEEHLDIDRAIPCGLIVNELLANAINHAFPDGRHGHIWVTLESSGAQLTLTVRDDGIGIPPNIDLATTQTFGLQIARTLSEQLEGRLELVRNGGTMLRLVFPRGHRPTQG